MSRPTNRVAKRVLRRRRQELQNRDRLQEVSDASGDEGEGADTGDLSDERAILSGGDTEYHSGAAPDVSLGGMTPRPLWERLRPSEHKLLFVSDDGREGHFLVAARKDGRQYHKSPRDFVFVGLRLVHCQGGTVFVGWCSAERECSEPTSHRELFPMKDLPSLEPRELPLRKRVCPCASELLAYLKGEDQVVNLLDMRRGYSALHEGGEVANVIGHWTISRKSYVIVNVGEGPSNYFSQWGVVRSLNGHYSCQVCHGRPRHCTHTHAVVAKAGESYQNDLEMSEKDFNGRISKNVDHYTGKLKISSVSQSQLPFFPENDDTVWAQLQGM